MAGITLTIEVDDKGTVKVKQFADEAKKAMKEMTDGPKQAQGPLASLQEGWIGITAKVAIATAAFYAAKRMIYDTAKEIASAGNDIARMSRTFNMSTDDLQKWSYVARMADVDIQGFGEGFKFLTRSMGEALQGSGDAAKAFNLLGINLKDTTGKTKDQQTVMLEVIGSLEKYADGVDRDTLMLAIFGRGWMSIKPLVDQGTKAIEENRLEAERLNAILGKDLIKSLSESEDAYKRWETVWKVSKMGFWTPMIKQFTDLLETILKIKGALSGTWEWTPAEEGAKKLYEYLKKAKQLPPIGERGKWEEMFGVFEGGGTETPSRIKEWVAGWTPPAKPQAPGIGAKSESDIVKEVQAAIDGVTAAEEMRGQVAIAQHELAELGWSKEKDIVENLHRIEMERAEQLADDMFPSMEIVKRIQDQMTEGGEKLRQELIKTQNLIRNFGWEDYASGAADASDAATRDVNRMALVAQYKVSGMGTIWESVAQNISSAWSSNMVNIIRSTESTSEKIKSFFQSIGDVFLSTVSKMISQWLLLGSITGEKGGWGSKGGGWGGILGSIINIFGKEGGVFPSWTPVKAFGQGGMVDRPTLGVFGEGGPEAVIPLKGGKIPIEGGRGDTYVNNTFIQATDVDSFARRYGGVIESIYLKGKRFNKMSMRQ